MRARQARRLTGLIGKAVGDVNLTTDMRCGLSDLLGRAGEHGDVRARQFRQLRQFARARAGSVERKSGRADSCVNLPRRAANLCDQLAEVGLQKIERFPDSIRYVSRRDFECCWSGRR